MRSQVVRVLPVVLIRFAIVGLSLQSYLGLAVEQLAAEQRPRTTTLSYGVDADLTYVDVLQGLKLIGAVGDAGGLDAQVGAYPRTLGLSRLRAVFDWQTPQGISFRLTLRPDSLSRRDESGADFVPREFDTRSGDSGMKPLPTIRVIDAYQINLPVADNLTTGVGVFEAFRPNKSAYRPILGFGLDVILPAKFSGLLLDWHSSSTVIATAAVPNPKLQKPAFNAQFYYFLGDQDRGELISGHGGSYDVGPSAKDPYQGGAVSLSWRPTTQVELSGTGGYLRSSELGGAYDSVFSQLTINSGFDTWNQRHRLSFDTRYEKDHGRSGVSPQNLLSGALSLALGTGPDTAVLLGVRAGRGSRWTAFSSQRSKTVSLSGYQGETGYQAIVDGGLKLALLATREFRTMNTDGQELVGFQDADGSKNLIHRVGLEISYQLNAND